MDDGLNGNKMRVLLQNLINGITSNRRVAEALWTAKRPYLGSLANLRSHVKSRR